MLMRNDAVHHLTGRWRDQWQAAPVDKDAVCRGCVADSAARRWGQHTVRARNVDVEVRETLAGAYCLPCFELLAACSVCGCEPTSHEEYPCVSCEMSHEAAMCAASGGRRSSPTYRGWSLAYNGKGQDNGLYERGRKSRRVHEG